MADFIQFFNDETLIVTDPAFSKEAVMGIIQLLCMDIHQKRNPRQMGIRQWMEKEI